MQEKVSAAHTNPRKIERDKLLSSKTAKPPCTVWRELNAVQIHVVLKDIEPPIWRRLVVPLTVTLAEFHYILQAAMGSTNLHLHQFEVGG